MALTKITGQVVDTTTDLVVGVTTVGGGVSAVDGFFSGIVTFSQGVSIGGTLTYEDVTNIDSVGLITARNGIVVGSGITLSKDGDVFFTGIATGNGSGLTNLPAANLTGTLPAISGANLTNLDASDLASGTVPNARISQGSVTQYVTDFDDDKIINDISALALKISALENSTASNTNSTFADTYQDSAGISTLTNTSRDTSSEFVSTATTSIVSYQFDQAGTHGQPSMFKLNTNQGNPVTGYWAEERVAEGTSDYGVVGVDFAFDLSGDFTHYFYHRVNGSGQASAIAYQSAGAYFTEKTDITTGKNPTYNGSTIFDVDLAANQSTDSGNGAYQFNQVKDNTFSSAFESHTGVTSAGGTNETGASAMSINYASSSNSGGLYFAKYFNVGSSTRHGTKFAYTKSNNTMVVNFITNDIGATTSADARITISNLPTAGRAFLFMGCANGGPSSSQFYGMKTDGSGVAVSSGSFTNSTLNATGSYESVAITAAATTSKMGVVVTYIDTSGTATLNTDLKISLSADNGSNYTQVTLVAQPNFATGVKMALANDVTISNTGTQLKYKVEFANQSSGSKETRVTGVSLQY